MRQRRCLERDLPSSVNLRSGLRRLKLAWPDHRRRVLIYTSKPDVKCDSNYAGKQILPNNISYHGVQDYSGGRHPCLDSDERCLVSFVVVLILADKIFFPYEKLRERERMR